MERKKRTYKHKRKVRFKRRLPRKLKKHLKNQTKLDLLKYDPLLINNIISENDWDIFFKMSDEEKLNIINRFSVRIM